MFSHQNVHELIKWHSLEGPATCRSFARQTHASRWHSTSRRSPSLTTENHSRLEPHPIKEGVAFGKMFSCSYLRWKCCFWFLFYKFWLRFLEFLPMLSSHYYIIQKLCLYCCWSARKPKLLDRGYFCHAITAMPAVTYIYQRWLHTPETATHFDTCMQEAKVVNPSLPTYTAHQRQVSKTVSGSPTLYLTD